MWDFILIAPLLLLLHINMASGAPGDVIFFLSNVTDNCSYNNVQMQADNNTAHGALCAYAKDANEIWACPAPDGSVQAFLLREC